MKMRSVLWMAVILVLSSSANVRASSIAKEGCPERCGSVSVPYPFGLDKSECAKNSSFLLNCAQNGSLFFRNIQIYNISLENGTFTGGIASAWECDYGRGKSRRFDQHINLNSWPFTVSPTHNKLKALGCDSMALMRDNKGSFGSGCVALCNSEEIEIDGSCSGHECCQTSIPKNVKTLDIKAKSASDNRSNYFHFFPCSYAFVVANSYNIAVRDFQGYPNKTPSPHVVFEWVVGERDCQASEGLLGDSCSDNANCTYSETGGGSRCYCRPGFTGNPYLPQGCQDIDECKDQKNPCQEGTCRNTFGNYICDCPLGMRGDGKVGCRGLRLTTIAIVIGGVILVIIITILIFIVCQRRKKEKYFRANGGMILKHQRIRIFSEAELEKATNNYDNRLLLGEGGFGSVYKGVLGDDTLVAVKKAKDVDKARMNQEFQHEIGVVSQVNQEFEREIDVVSQVNHRNVVKLLGLCLETKVPLLVYEFISNGTLHHHIHDKGSQILGSWKNRLRIATETALALDYLHSLAEPPIIHGDVKSMNILLDDHYTAKVSDFGASVFISPNQTRKGSKIQGTIGYLDPEYLMTGILTTKSDVYSFGVVMVELLTGEKPISSSRDGEKRNIILYFMSSVEDNRVGQVLNFKPADDGEMEEVEAVAELVKRCLNRSGLKRPTMKVVAEELTRLKKLSHNFWAHQGSEETECLLGESSSHTSYEFSNINMDQMDTYSVHKTFDIERGSTVASNTSSC
ncbi:hypothetical protein SLEP1_g17119 [Rubroshorea leprosula]|uniref:Uncharacterized protein n=1 Tax=Rubroshorea leprosula TaxID=152421 RepID=A0AAV5IT97_9ROSI|nr:hypothetical protein SLEP1_g17119 [Rubroshorea leprosula]